VAWRRASLALAVLVLLLVGLLVRATRPGPTHAAGIYSQWATLMYGALAPNTIGIWNGPIGIARGPYAFNQRAMGMLSGVNITGDTDAQLQYMTSDLMTINQQLDLMLSSTLQETNRVKQQSDARYVRTVIRQDILVPLSGGRSSGDLPLPQMMSDDRALAMTPHLCRIAATVEVRALQRFYQGGAASRVSADLFAACAQHQESP